MVPPRLTLVSDNSRDMDSRDMDESASEDESTAGRGASARAQSYQDPEAVADGLAQQARRETLRKLEAMLFASAQPLDAKSLRRALEASDDLDELLAELQKQYQPRGVNLVKVAGKWLFRTADDLSYLLEKQTSEERKLSKAALETLAIIAYHQPVTRAEIEEIRGVSISPGTLDLLMETVWIRPRGRRRAPGRPITYGTTEMFLTQFGLDNIKDLPGIAELKAAGLLDANLPPGFAVPEPTDVAALMPDELPLGDDGIDTQEALPLDDDSGDDDGLHDDALQDEPGAGNAEDGKEEPDAKA